MNITPVQSLSSFLVFSVHSVTAITLAACAQAQVIKFEGANSLCTFSMNANGQLESSCALATASGGSIDARLRGLESKLESALMSGYLCTVDSDIASNGISMGSATTQAECEAACSEKSNCTAFTMPGCNLKSSITTGTSSGVTACKKTLLVPAPPPPPLGGPNNPAFSCKDILDSGVTASGTYSIKPVSTVFEVYCDMQTDGGGWTMVHKTNSPESPNYNGDVVTLPVVASQMSSGDRYYLKQDNTVTSPLLVTTVLIS
jgi:hypothetical protein